MSRAKWFTIHLIIHNVLLQNDENYKILYKVRYKFYLLELTLSDHNHKEFFRLFFLNEM